MVICCFISLRGSTSWLQAVVLFIESLALSSIAEYSNKQKFYISTSIDTNRIKTWIFPNTKIFLLVLFRLIDANNDPVEEEIAMKPINCFGK